MIKDLIERDKDFARKQVLNILNNFNNLAYVSRNLIDNTISDLDETYFKNM